MPNRAAKARKQERRKKNEYLKKHGRTAKQIARKKRRENAKGVGDVPSFGRKKW